MTIHVQTSGELHRVGVPGTLGTLAERAELIGMLDAVWGKETARVEFYDADTLPPEVIEALVRRLDRGAPLKIVAHHALLGHCLLRLGIPVQQAPGKGLRTSLPPCRALALAGSAQSLDKILHIIARLPVGEVAVFLAQHVPEDRTNLLDSLLKAHTEYKVLMPQHLVPVVPGTIYVAPPGHHMKVAHGLIYLTRDPKVQFARPSIDVLFASLALEYGEGLLAALLCGFGTDGVAGCAAITAAGGRMLLEDADDCQDARMLPEAALAAGAYSQVHRVAGLAAIAAAAAQGGPAGTDVGPVGSQLDLFLEALWCRYGYDFRGYQRDSLERRIRHLMSRFGLANFETFQWDVLGDEALFQRLVAEVSVGVSGFFRHPEQFLQLREEVLPYLDSFPVIKVWSAGCATGEESYSLAILLREMGLAPKSRVFATDLNHYFLELAAAGQYPLADLETSRANYLEGGGHGAFDDHVTVASRSFRVREEVRAIPLHHRNSLIDEGVFNEFQLIVCRNVMIYFDLETQKKVLEKFARSLHPDGFLLLGPQDSLTGVACAMGFVPCNPGKQLYRFRKGGEGG